MFESTDGAAAGFAMDDEGVYRRFLLGRACRSGEKATIEGVDFDLCHPELSRNEWEPTTILGSLAHADIYTPRLLFPWSSVDEKSVFEERGEGVKVGRGDTVTVGSVQIMNVRADHGELDHPHHRERRWAKLLIKRRSGKSAQVPQFWEFRGVADVMTPLNQRDYRQARYALLARLSDALGLDSIDDFLLAKSPADWPAFAETAKPLDRLAAEVLWAAEGEYVEEAAMAFGYLIGRAEAGSLLLPLAERQIQQRDQRRSVARQPRKSGNETRTAALAVISEHPDISRRKCAEKVATLRNLSDVKGVERTIAKFFYKDEKGRYRVAREAVVSANRLVDQGDTTPLSPEN